MSEIIVSSLEAHDVDVHLNSKVQSFETTSDGRQVSIITNDEPILADFVIVCTGFVPNIDLLASQVQLDQNGAIATNQWQETSNPDVLAAGDVCSTYVTPMNQKEYFALATHAIRQGYAVGHNLFGHIHSVAGSQLTTALRFFSHTLAVSGLSLNRALAAGFNAHSVTYNGAYRPYFMPSNAAIKIKLVYDAETRKILGAQFFGDFDLTQSANAISLCIQNKIESMIWRLQICFLIHTMINPLIT